MKITAKYASTCPSCGHPINPGDQVEWERGKKATHITCPQGQVSKGPFASVPGGAQHPKGRNKRAASCDRCGKWLAAGEGELVRCYADTGCMKHFDDDGWHVYCLPGDAGCEKRRAERIAEHKAAKEKAVVEKAAKAEQETAQRAKLEALRAELKGRGYIRVGGDMAPLNGGSRELVLAAKCGLMDVSVYRGEHDGHEIYWEVAHGYDDHRQYTWGEPAVLLPWLDERIGTSGITKAQAKNWLKLYSGCEGEEFYQRALEIGADEEVQS